MTALVFALEEHQICIAMDTLVVGFPDKEPLAFQRKFLPLPDIDMVIAGTGLLQIIGCWINMVANDKSIRGIEHLNELAPEALSLACRSVELASTTTLYHFGRSERTGKYVGYAYRSKDRFKSEALAYGLGVKPPVPVAPVDVIRFPEFMIGLMRKQQEVDLCLPVPDKVGIGGEIDFVLMANGSIDVETVHSFANYEADKSAIRRNQTNA